MDEKISTIEEQHNSQNNKIYAKTSLEVHSESSGGHYPSYVMVWWECPIRGWHLFIFARKVWQLVSDCIKRTCCKQLWNLLTWLSSMVRNGSSSRTQLLPTNPRRLRSDCGGKFRLYQSRGLALGESRLHPLNYKLWAVLEDMACRKRHNNLDSLKRCILKAAAEIWRRCVPR